ncbi:retinal-specific phospholipid-transporting ATPase ABCA4 [Neodiprion lecontei]|uniref:Retinal-specific phospholipid-transporting ATPase ABCA4 n=1 Tax=Neodiprion lecontei TaxID=441921 RepID=A0A6J0C5A1_NEOLC|nr:retinal-specific phospholipid-transporting ATPase ABCA4 [Neodiprion lecontei]XP_046585839.1 retinal-specific phospholipid-transporting ATPase ABCA4 [Neodiprion lecontei]XP_046585840.1 retinal-specific phospholipid-transporting ATPase ABCA4 [Neodiprion lecontei]XP_046585841.1 retinal-specific phospholipid-transporting ATPase ABCA4 [Neodiprion lecontei]
MGISLLNNFCTRLKHSGFLIYKNIIVRKRHLIGTLIEILLPACIVATILAVRSNLDVEPIHVRNSTYYEMRTSSEVVRDTSRSRVRLYYKPQTELTKNLMRNVTECMGILPSQLSGFNSEEVMLHHYETQQATDSLVKVLAIDFDDMDDFSDPKKLIYTIRSSQKIPDKLLDVDIEGISTASDHLLDEIPVVGFQICLDNAFIESKARDGAIKPMVSLQKMPFPPYDKVNANELQIQNVICTIGGLIFLATIYLIPTYISAEKSTGVNTLLKINGIKSYQNFLSWIACGMVFSIIIVSSITTIVKLNFRSDQKPFYYHTDCCIIWLTLFINLTAIYAFCLHLATYFSKTWLAQLVATTVSLIINITATQFENYDKSTFLPWIGFLCPTTATMRIFDELNRRENQRVGAQWSNVLETTHPALNYWGSLGFIMLSNFMGIVFHFILAVYLDAVLPSKYGINETPLFFIKYFKKNKVCSSSESTRMLNPVLEPEIYEHVADNSLYPGVKLTQLVKRFIRGIIKRNTIKAVQGLSLEFYKGQITALLGHNGAGKSTTFAVLTGLTSPSSGSVEINGKDITADIDGIRSDLGVCLQENTMFPDLTVVEQLRIVGLLKQKDRTRKELMAEIDELLKKMDMEEKRDVMPDELSGGQKRRLCLAMALIGNASTIFLDEPTSGMDPETQRGTWDTILKYRDQKTIIITTHSMEEADVLGDRIAIMDSGKLKCYGSPMYLKKCYGHNHHEITLSTTSNYDIDKIRELVGSDASINVTQHGRIVINLPFTSSLPEILDSMENQKAKLGITGLSVSIITLEQVFLRAADNEEIANKSEDNVDGKVAQDLRGYEYLTGWDLTWQMIYALLAKKMTYFKANKGVSLALVCGTLIAILLPLVFNPADYGKKQNLRIELRTYKSPEVMIHSGDETLGNMYKKIIENQGAKIDVTEAGVSLSKGLLSRALKDMTYYKTRMIVSAEFNSSVSVNGLYSGGATLSAPIVLNTMSNLLLKIVAGDQYSIDASIGQLPRSLVQDAQKRMENKVEMLMRNILFMAIFVHVVALFVIHPLLENSTRFKQLQQMAGVSPFTYWGTMFLVDYGFYILVSLFAVFGIVCRDFFDHLSAVFFSECGGVLLLLFLLFGINALLLAYIHSFMKKRFHVVYSILSGIPLLIVFIIVPLHEVLSYMDNVKWANVIQRRIFSLAPVISFVFGCMKWEEIAFKNARCRAMPKLSTAIACDTNDYCCALKCSDGYCENPLPFLGDFSEQGGIKEYIVYLLFTPIILVGILYLLEQQTFAKLRSKFQVTNHHSKRYSDETIDRKVEEEKRIVCQEINNINRGSSEFNSEIKNVFLASGLSKHYGKVEAVKEVSFRVLRNECFGLLGVNGAGKSSTFRMLVGEEIPNSGILYRGRYSSNSDRTKYLAGMGYCPQTDALIPCLNAVEQLTLFARLRGIPKHEVASEVYSWINKLQLTKHATKPSGDYSGGNKRRLNIAIALIANPELVLLDEPTTGVDPAAKRLVWTVLQNCQASGQAIILTSHSMAECEVLCNRLVIMAKGQLVCVGASQELKERFVAGFNITIKLDPRRTEHNCTRIKKKIETNFICRLIDEHPGYLFYHVTDPQATWVKMFGTMNDIQSVHQCVEDFTVSTSTLEQLFMQFARPTDSTTQYHIQSETAAEESCV